MAKPKFTLYKHIKIDGQWRYFRAALASNNKVKPHVVVPNAGASMGPVSVNPENVEWQKHFV